MPPSDRHSSRPPVAGLPLAEALRHTVQLHAIRRSDLAAGDLIVVRTSNSLYTLRAESRGLYLATGGWFDRNGLSPHRIAINGCTWGGTIIKVDLLAACGLCIEFGNRVITSPVRAIAVLRAAVFN